MIQPGWEQRRFDDALAGYMARTSRTVVSVLNTKAFYVARKAIRFTDKTRLESIDSTLGRMVKTPHTTKKGKTIQRRSWELASGASAPAPLAALIINKRLGRAGKPGLSGRAMRKAVRDLIGARRSSVAFIKSGWLPAVKILARLADGRYAPGADEAARQVGRPKGDAIPASATDSDKEMRAIIINSADAKHDRRGALAAVGGRGLGRAFDDEASSMVSYLADKVKADQEAANQKLA